MRIGFHVSAPESQQRQQLSPALALLRFKAHGMTHHKSTLTLALVNVEHAIQQSTYVDDSKERPSPPIRAERLSHAIDELEAARASLRAAIGLHPETHMPVGESSCVVTPPASTGSRRGR